MSIIERAKTLKANGYTAAFVEVVATSSEISWEGTQERYNDDLEQEKRDLENKVENPIIPRAVGREYFNTVVEDLPKSIDELHRSGEFEQIRLIDREGGIYYDSKETPDLNPAEILKECLAGERNTLTNSIKTQAVFNGVGERPGVTPEARAQVAQQYQQMTKTPVVDIAAQVRK